MTAGKNALRDEQHLQIMMMKMMVVVVVVVVVVIVVIVVMMMMMMTMETSIIRIHTNSIACDSFTRRLKNERQLRHHAALSGVVGGSEPSSAAGGGGAATFSSSKNFLIVHKNCMALAAINATIRQYLQTGQP